MVGALVMGGADGGCPGGGVQRPVAGLAGGHYRRLFIQGRIVTGTWQRMAALRFLGGLCLLVGVLALINDLTKWQLGISETISSPLSSYLTTFAPGTLATAERAVRLHVSPFVWDPLIVGLMALSVWLIFLVAGLALLWLGRRRHKLRIFVN